MLITDGGDDWLAKGEEILFSDTKCELRGDCTFMELLMESKEISIVDCCEAGASRIAAAPGEIADAVEVFVPRIELPLRK